MIKDVRPYSWNPVFNLVMKIKSEYKEKLRIKWTEAKYEVPMNYKERIIQTANSIYDYMRITKEKVEKYYEKAPKEDRKKYMIWVSNNCPKEIQGYLRQKYLNAEYHVLKTSYANSTRYKKMREIGLGHEYFNLFGDMEE